MIIEAECSNVADTSVLIPVQSCLAQTPAQQSECGREWPQETVPYPIARAMEFCFENCQLSQRNREPTDSVGLDRQICRFPQHCSIVPRIDKP